MTCVECTEDDSIALIFVLSAIAVALLGLWLMWRYVLSNKSLVVRYVATFIKYKSPQAVVTPYLGASAGLIATTVGSAMLLPHE